MPGCEQQQLLASCSQEGPPEHSRCPLPSKGGGPGKLLCKHLPPHSDWLFFLHKTEAPGQIKQMEEISPVCARQKDITGSFASSKEKSWLQQTLNVDLQVMFADDTKSGGKADLIEGRKGGIWTGWIDGLRPIV